ncbi:MAG: hypothetical protein KAI53_00450 [Candidatus Aenigmarchaeota archaeon]|nr:hypothetical protein [Candidatus Aenigmarchaeota archaeon]
MNETKQPIKRLVAYKVTIADVVDGNYKAQEGFNPSRVEISWGLSVSRVHIIATVVNHYKSEDSKYAFITLDDGTGVIRSKAFQQDTKFLEKIKKGDIVDVIGRIREYNDERYIVPEVVRVVDDYNMITLRKLETTVFKNKFLKKEGMATKQKEDGKKERVEPEKKKKTVKNTPQKQEPKPEKKKDAAKETKKPLDDKEIRERVVKTIEVLDDGEGVDYTDILKNVDLEDNLIEKAIDELLSEGSCYEPRAGKIKVL